MSQDDRNLILNLLAMIAQGAEIDTHTFDFDDLSNENIDRVREIVKRYFNL